MSMLEKMIDKAVQFEADGDHESAQRWLDKALTREAEERARAAAPTTST